MWTKANNTRYTVIFEGGSMRFRAAFLWLFAVLVLVGPLLSACENLPTSDEIPTNTVTVLAGSELKDIEPLLQQIYDNTGVMLELEYTGTLDGMEQLLGGKQVDLAWFSHAKYLTLVQGENRIVKSQEKIMLSPVIMGVKKSKAQEWGWVDNPDLTWNDIAQKSGSGELQYAMTNPASSNSGFTSLVGVAAALSGSSDALRVEDINNEAMSTFFKGLALTAGSSGWLAESYVREQGRLNGLINYESILLQLNASGQLNEPLHLIYPKEGIITADYPLMLINEERREDYNALVEYLLSPEMQRALMEQTLRRPVLPEVSLDSRFPNQLLIELPFPNSSDVIDALIFAYLDKQRVPSHSIFVLDASGSMLGEGLQDLKQAIFGLCGQDQSITGRFSRFREREEITMIIFDSEVRDIKHFRVQNADPQGPDMQAIRQYVNAIEAVGGTAIFSSLREAYQLAAKAKQNNPDRYYSIVLMSDGENTDGIPQNELISFYRSLPPEIQQIKTFTVLFGNADMQTMQSLANETGGRVFDATTTSLDVIFKDIRGYQ
jgi:Ca-activated chloride channel family protein